MTHKQTALRAFIFDNISNKNRVSKTIALFAGGLHEGSNDFQTLGSSPLGPSTISGVVDDLRSLIFSAFFSSDIFAAHQLDNHFARQVLA